MLVEELDAAQPNRECAERRLLVVLEVEQVLAQFFFVDTIGGLALVLRQLPHGAVTGESRYVNQDNTLAKSPALTRAQRGRLDPLVRPPLPIARVLHAYNGLR